MQRYMTTGRLANAVSGVGRDHRTQNGASDVRSQDLKLVHKGANFGPGRAQKKRVELIRQVRFSIFFS